MARWEWQGEDWRAGAAKLEGARGLGDAAWVEEAGGGARLLGWRRPKVFIPVCFQVRLVTNLSL